MHNKIKKIIKKSISLAKSIIPQKWVYSYRKKKYAGDTFYCNFCNSNMSKMMPKGKDTLASKKYEIIGAGRRENAFCSICKSTDRERFIYYYLQKYTQIFDKFAVKLLHFAPETQLKKIFESNDNIQYYPCDIDESRAKYKVDITNIQFQDNMFDYIICSHVMEHILNERKALKELKRVLKPNGTLILSFPITMKNITIDGVGDETQQQREELFGQKDHVRLYGTDTIERFEKYGFNVERYQLNFDEQEELKKYSFIKDDILFILKK